MAETRHLRLDYEETLNAKKQLLSSQINLISITKKLKRYRLLRRKELVQKTKLKTSIASLRAKLNTLLSTLPIEQATTPDPKKSESRKENQEEKNLSEELEDIQLKLARLQ